MELEQWLQAYLQMVQALFGERICCVGLQGSYGRGEAGADSDIDVVLINYVLPALIATVILSAPLYLIIRQINKKLGVENNTDDILTAFEDVEDDEDKVRY